MKRLLRPHTLLRLAFFLTLFLALAFALRLGVGIVYWNANQARPIEAWMPVGYVARSWEVPAEVLAEALGIEPGTLPRQSLERIASQQGMPVSEAVARLQAAIDAYQSTSP